MEPCGTPTLTGNHSDVWPLSSTLWNLLLKKLSIRHNRELETSDDLSLKISPSYQTLSKSLRHIKKYTTSSKIRVSIKSFK